MRKRMRERSRSLIATWVLSKVANFLTEQGESHQVSYSHLTGTGYPPN